MPGKWKALETGAGGGLIGGGLALGAGGGLAGCAAVAVWVGYAIL